MTRLADPSRRRCLQLAAAASVLPLTGCRWGEDPMPILSSGRADRLRDLPSRHLGSRTVDVWRPEGYDGRTRHPVIYMHDGQAAFDGAMSISKTGWRIDQAIARRPVAYSTPAPIIVAIWNHPTARHVEFFPQPILDRLDRAARERAREQVPLTMRLFAGDLLTEGRSRSEAYLAFLVEELKPLIDQRYATRAGREDTMLLGSSMGGLISVNALLAHPDVFGAAATLSTHWIGLLERNDDISDAAVAWLRSALPDPTTGLRWYMDRGTRELDAQYVHAHGQVDALLQEHGFVPPQVVSRVFDGAGHNEGDWAKRLDIPLAFLLDTREPSPAGDWPRERADA